MERIRITNLICTALVTGTLLAACSGGSSEADALPTRKATAASVAAARAKAKADQHNAELVSGVTLGKPGAPVDLKFELGAKPVVHSQGRRTRRTIAFGSVRGPATLAAC